MHKTERSLDFDSTPAESTTRRVHTPRLFVQEDCIEQGCGRLRRLAGEVAVQGLASMFDNQFQKDIVCTGKRLGLCQAEIVDTGDYSTFGNLVPGSDELYLPNPALLQGGNPQLSTTDKIIAHAIAQGATEHSIEALRRR